MANSDNVMRGGLTPKHIDVTELLRVVDFSPGFGGLLEPRQEAAGVWHYPVPAPEFDLWRLELAEDPVPVPAPGSGRILLVTEGSATLRVRRRRARAGPGRVRPADRGGEGHGGRPGHRLRRRPRRVLEMGRLARHCWRGAIGSAPAL